MKVRSMCINCAMDETTETDRCSRRRITVQIIVDLILWITVSAPVLYLFLNGKPYQTGFFCDDTSLSYPYKPSTISTPILVVVGLSASVILVVSIETLNRLNNKCQGPCLSKDTIKLCVKSYVVFLIGFLIEEMFVEVVKNTFGALRPNFFDVCNPQFNRTLCPGYVSEYTCTRDEDDKFLRNSRQSFPSGHAAFSMYIAIYFSMYMEYQLQIRYSRLLKIFLQSGLVLVAILCGLGRIKDHKHHPSDVVAGFILGTTVAVFVHVFLGRMRLKTNSDANSPGLRVKDDQCDCCCTCQQSSELTKDTQPSLLQNEFEDSMENCRDSSSAKLIALQNNNHFQTSSQGIPKFQIEDI